MSNTIENEVISKTYQMKTDRQHVLDAPDTYIGSIVSSELKTWTFDEPDNILVEKNINYIEALLKLFDECIINARDHSIRMSQKKINEPDNDNINQVSYIDVNITEDGTITICNDGNGIDVIKHPEHLIWVPELIFAHLRTSTNYNKDEQKIVGGKNGYGVKLIFIWSTSGEIETLDHVRGLRYKQQFRDNMSIIEVPIIAKVKSPKSFTKITFKPDYTRLGISGLTPEMALLFKKRVFDIAAVTNSKIKVRYNNELVPVKNFKNYIELFIADKSTIIYESTDDRWEYAISLCPNGEFTQISFVNGINTLSGGKHVEYILNKIVGGIIDYIEKKKKMKVSASSIKEQLFLFLRCDIVNPSFDSQSKTKLTTLVSQFGSSCVVSDKFIEKVIKLGVMDTACKINQIKENKTIAKKTDGVKSRNITGIPKLNDANFAGTEKSKDCTLILCEGDSAKAGVLSGLSSKDKDVFGIYPLKGKMLNVRGETALKISANKEITEFKKILGLENGKVYKTIQDVNKHLRYSKILIFTDQDLDGSHIKALIINVFDSEWSSLIEIPSFISFMNTPILKASKSSKEILFYNQGEYEDWKEDPMNLTGWKVKYYKGLGTSTASEFKDYFKNPKMVGFNYTEECRDNIDKLFNKKRADDRKEWLKDYDRKNYLNTSTELISYKEFIDKELIHFSKYDCDRNIPNMVDGLKTSQRKILYCAFKRNLVTEIKVGQFSGYVSEHSNYHHGEASLNGAIIGLAQNYMGSNNINLLVPSGQFGCLSPDTPILMWDGSIKNAEFIKIDDELIGDDGNKRIVLNTTFGIDDMYELVCDNGKSMIINSQHILTLYFHYNNKIMWNKNSWILLYFNGKTINQKSVKTNIGITKSSNHFNKSKLNKDDAYKIIIEYQKQIQHKYNSNDIIDIKLEDYLKLSKSNKRLLYTISNLNCINWDKKFIPIDPYILGAWLGDGDHLGKGFTSADEEVIKRFALWVDTINGELTHHQSINHDGYHYTIKRKNSGNSISIGDIEHNSSTCLGCLSNTGTIKNTSICNWTFEKSPYTINYGLTSNGQLRTDLNPFTELLKQNNLYKNKHIPIEYILNDKKTRLELLAGFIDTDGCIKSNNTGIPHIEISQSKRLHENLIISLNFIAQSLGFSTTISYSQTTELTKNGFSKTMINLFIFGDNIHEIPTIIQRKQINFIGSRTIKQNNYLKFNINYLGKNKFCGWSINNNERFLLGNFIVTHNSRLANGHDHASERYIFTLLTKITKTIFNPDDNKILEYLDDDGTIVEPLFYIPILPMILVNGTRGIGTGFSSTVLSYNPFDIVSYLKHKIGDNGEEYIFPISPYYEGFNGSIIPLDEVGKSFMFKGNYTVISDEKIHITELPVGYSTDKFRELIEEFREATDADGKKIIPLIKEFKDNSTDVIIDILITFQKEQLAELLNVSHPKNPTGCNNFEKKMKLYTTESTGNMHLFNEEDKLVYYEKVEDIIDAFYGVRLEYYQKRKDYIIDELEKVLVVLRNKVKYIESILDESIDLRHKNNDAINAMMEENGFDKIDDDFEYLINLPMKSVSIENVDKLTNLYNSKSQELELIKNKTVKQSWSEELAKFETEYTKFRAELIADKTSTGSSETVAKKAVKKAAVAKKTNI